MIKTGLSIHLDELQPKLAVACGVHVSIATVGRTLSRIGLSRNTVSRYASKQNNSGRAPWELHLAQYTEPNIFAFLDESAVDESFLFYSDSDSSSGSEDDHAGHCTLECPNLGGAYVLSLSWLRRFLMNGIAYLHGRWMLGCDGEESVSNLD